MKKRLKGLASIWLVAALVCSMLLPVSAAGTGLVHFYRGDLADLIAESDWGGIAAGDSFNESPISINFDERLSTQHNVFDQDPSIVPQGQILRDWTLWRVDGSGNVYSGYSTAVSDEAGISAGLYAEADQADKNAFPGAYPVLQANWLKCKVELEREDFSVSAYVIDGDTESLTDAVTYQWYTEAGDEVEGQTGKELGVAARQPGQTYYCAVTFGAEFDTYTINSDTVYIPVSVTGVSLDQKTLSLEVGKTGTLTADVAPTNADNKTVSWKSSNESVATVDENGKVTAVGAGTAIITVTTGDGGITATCVVTVAAPEQPPVEGIEIFVGGVELPDTGRFFYSDETGLEERGESDGWNVYVTGNDIDGYTMTISGLNVVGAPIALQSDVEKLTLIVEGENALKGTDGENSLGILAKNLTIQGTGSLIAQGGKTTDSNSYGIGAERSLVISGGTVTAQAGDSENGDSYGIGTMGDVTITGGTVTATGGTAGKQSHGIGVVGNISISGGTVTAESGVSEGGNSYGIGATGSITVEGTAQVTANGKEAQAQSATFSLRARTTPVGGSSYGIGAVGSVNVKSGIVTATGGTADNSSNGIGAMDKVTIANGTVTANGGTADSSIGIGAMGEVTITGGSVAATGAQGAAASCGIVSKAVAISGGTVTATGGKTTGQPSDGTTNGNSYGIGATAGGMTITGGTVTAKAGDSVNANSYGIGSTGDVTIKGGTVTAEGGAAKLRSHGIGAEGSVTIEGGTVTATGGNATDDNSYGIGAEGDVTISGSTVTAEAGVSDNAGSFGIGTTGGITIQNKADVTAKGPRGEGSDKFNSYGMGAYSDIRISTDCTIDTSGDALAIVTQSGKIEIVNKGTCGKEANGKIVIEFPVWKDTSSFRMWPSDVNDGTGTGGTVQPGDEPGDDSDDDTTGSGGGTSKPSGGSTGGTASHSCVSKCAVCGGCTDLKCSWNVCKNKCTLLTMSFTDLEQDAWYNTAVGYAYHHGLMAGVGGGKFDPYGATTRGMIVTILWNLEGKPAAKSPMTFLDVPADEWYAPAVAWAAAEGVVAGHSKTVFAPTDPITREQLATILWNYAKYKGMDVSVGENTNILSYNDAFDISDWAFPGLQWACGAGIMSGKGDGILDPLGNAKRCEAAQMLMALLEG